MIVDTKYNLIKFWRFHWSCRIKIMSKGNQDLFIVAQTIKELSNEVNPIQADTPPIKKVSAQLIEISSDSSDEEFHERFVALENKSESAESKKPIRSVHEIPLDQIDAGEIPESLPPSMELIRVGSIHHHCGVFSVAVTERPVSPGTLIVDKDRRPITRVIDLFGPVERPQMIIRAIIPIGTPLFVPIDEYKSLNPDEIAMKNKGCDASNRYDEESPFQDFSDDEEERLYKKHMKNAKKEKKEKNLPGVLKRAYDNV